LTNKSPREGGLTALADFVVQPAIPALQPVSTAAET
jgi:hypothetical protein